MPYYSYWEIVPNFYLATTTKPNWFHRKMFLWCFGIKWVETTEVFYWKWKLGE